MLNLLAKTIDRVWMFATI